MIGIWFEGFPKEVIDSEPSQWFKLYVRFYNEFPVKIKKLLIYQVSDIEINIKYNNKEYKLLKNDLYFYGENELLTEKIWEFEIQIIPKLPLNKLELKAEVTF